jgi:hypothetical protein
MSKITQHNILKLEQADPQNPELTNTPNLAASEQPTY